MKRHETKGTIQGRITDKNTGKPLFGVSVAIDEKGISTRTDIRGKFTISNVRSGDCILKCQREGYKSVSRLRMKIEHDTVAICDCQLEPKNTVPLNEPVVLLPLRLEIRKHIVPDESNSSVTKVATYTSKRAAVSAINTREFSSFEEKSSIQSTKIGKNEYWLRWYPDDIHYLTPVGKIAEDEKAAWEQFYKVYEKHKDLGSVKGLHTQDLYNLSFEILTIFYGKSPGKLSADELARCEAYDEQALLFISEEEVGVREVLGWEDTKNPSIKLAWVEFAKTFGSVRAKQISKAFFDDKWDYDTDIDEEEPMEILMDQGISLPTLPEEVSIYTVNNSKTKPLIENITINRENLLVGPTELEGTLWMTDFSKAVEAGMGIIINDPLKTKQIDLADWLIVVGINETIDSRKALEEILRRNNASGELALLAQDSPTNNTDSVTTPYTWLETDAESYLKSTRMKIPAAVVPIDLSTQLNTKTLDAHKLSDLFNFSDSTLSEMPEADLSEMVEAGAMAALLWSSCTSLFQKTWSNEFKQHFSVESQVSNSSSLGDFFIQNVRARGTLPILRVGEHPYGILPIISLRDWCGNLSHQKNTKNMCDIITFLKDDFLKLASEVPIVDQEEGNIYETLLEVLRYSPVSKRVDVRTFDSNKSDDLLNNDPKNLGCALVKDKSNASIKNENISFPETAYLDELSRINRADFNPACFDIDSTSPLLKRLIKHFLWLVFADANEPSKCELKGKVVDGVSGKTLPNVVVAVKGTDSTTETDKNGEFNIKDVPPGIHEVEVLHSRYTGVRNVNVVIDSHLSNKVDFNLSPKIEAETNIASNQVPKTKSNSIKGNIVDSKSGKAIKGALIGVKGTGRSVLTNAQGEYSIDSLPVGDHQVSISTAGYDTFNFSTNLDDQLSLMEFNSTLTQINQNSGVKVDPTTTSVDIPGGLELIADAANLLKEVHPDKLEILLIETLDLFSHRLDAWLTGLANSELIKCQHENSIPPPVGVYGWLEKPGGLDTSPPEPEFIQAPSVKQATTAAILRNAAIHNGTDDDSGAFQVNLSSSQIRKGMWYLESLRQGHLPGEILGYRLERLIHDESRKKNSKVNDKDVFTLRDKYPLSIHVNANSEKSTSTLTVIDGEKFLDDKNTNLKYTEIKDQLNQFKDAATDIAICEVTHADDNVARRSGWLGFLDGECLPPQEEFVRSQRTGDIQGTKVFLQIPSPDNFEAYESSTNPRVIADPILATFCETLLPDFGLKEIEVELTITNNKQNKASRAITFFARELNMDAIDLVIGGIEELKLKTRYYLLSCWKNNDPTDTSIAHACNILGSFPDFDKADDLLNEIGIDLIAPKSLSDTSSIFTYIAKAKLIRNLLHKNRSKNSLGTIHPEELPIVNQETLEKIDPLGGIEVLSKRFRRIRNQLIEIISSMARASSELKKRHIIIKGLQECQRAVLLLKEQSLSGNNDINNNATIDLLENKVTHLIKSDPDFNILAEHIQILDQINQLKNDDSALDQFDSLRIQIQDLENEFNTFLESSAKALVTDTKTILVEVSKFGLERALTIFPDNPTVESSVKIITLFDQLIAALISKASHLIIDSPNLKDHIQCLKVVCLNGFEVDQILYMNRGSQDDSNEQLRNRLPLTEVQSRIVLNKNFQNGNHFELLLNSLLYDINALNQVETYYENYLICTKVALIDDPEGAYHIIKNSTSNVLTSLMEAYKITNKQAEIIVDFKLDTLEDDNPTLIQEVITSTTNSKISEIISLLQAVTDKEGMVILTPYLLTKYNNTRLKWDVDYSELVSLTGPTYLREYRQIRPAVSKLYELFDVGNEVVIYEDKHFQRLDSAELSYKKEGNTDYLYLTQNNESLHHEEYLAFLLLDQWQEGIPNPDDSENTGIALRYESPQAEAPNAIIIAVPPSRSSTEFWGIALLANTLLETIELMQVRMVNSIDVTSHFGQLLPSLLFESTKDGKPLFPSRERFNHDYDIGSHSGYVLASQLSKSELLKTETPTIRNENPKSGGSYANKRRD